MKPQVIQADIAGCMVKFPNDDTYYVGEYAEQGNIYKSKKAFDEHEGICYIPEYEFFDEIGIDENVSDEMIEWMRKNAKWYVQLEGYTRDDLYAEMYETIPEGWIERKSDKFGKAFVEEFIDEETAYIFQEIEWQTPFTFIEEMDWEEDWEDYLLRSKPIK